MKRLPPVVSSSTILVTVTLPICHCIVWLRVSNGEHIGYGGDARVSNRPHHATWRPSPTAMACHGMMRSIVTQRRDVAAAIAEVVAVREAFIKHPRPPKSPSPRDAVCPEIRGDAAAVRGGPFLAAALPAAPSQSSR